jgi:hypothetical protein
MSIKTQNKNNARHIVYSNHNLFDIVKDRVKLGNEGATVFIPHVCNNIDLFGAGFAAQVADKYPIIKENYHLLGKSFLKTNLGYSQIVKAYENDKFKHKLFFVNMIAQNGIKSHNNERPLNYLALVKSMNTLSQYIHTNTGFINNNEKIEIHCPKFGSGLAGGNWNFIENLIEDIWGQFFVTVYNYSPSSNKKFK